MTPKELGEKMLSAVKEYVARKVGDAVQSFDKRIDALSAKLTEMDSLVNAIPAKGDKGDPGENGTSVSVEDVLPVIRSEIEKQVSAIEKPKDGKDADPEAIALQIEQGIAKALPGAVEQALKALLPDIIQRAAGLASDAVPRPVDGKNGKDADEAAILESLTEQMLRKIESLPKPKDGEPGKDADPQVIIKMVEDAVSQIPKPKDGESVHPDTVSRMVREEVSRVVSEIPKPRDGQDGLDAHEIEYVTLDVSKRYPRGTHAKHNGGIWRAYEATEGMNGWECLVEGHPTSELQQVDERTIKFVVTKTSGEVSETVFKFPVIIYREIWREGSYEKGDVVTFGGSGWHCQEPTTDKPGTSKAWKLMIKEGRPGRDGGTPAPKSVEPVRIR